MAFLTDKIQSGNLRSQILCIACKDIAEIFVFVDDSGRRTEILSLNVNSYLTTNGPFFWQWIQPPPPQHAPPCSITSYERRPSPKSITSTILEPPTPPLVSATIRSVERGAWQIIFVSIDTWTFTWVVYWSSIEWVMQPSKVRVNIFSMSQFMKIVRSL